jgi:hypothetical protein
VKIGDDMALDVNELTRRLAEEQSYMFVPVPNELSTKLMDYLKGRTPTGSTSKLLPQLRNIQVRDASLGGQLVNY